MERGLVWLLLLALASLTGCRGQRESVVNLVERQEALSQEVEALKREVSETRRSYLKSIQEKELDFQGFADQVRRLSTTADAIRETMQEFALYKQAYRKQARAKAPGTELGDLPVGSQIYRGAKVREVTDTHVAITHENGTTRLPLSAAPPALQDLFAYDPLLDAVVEQASGTGTDWLLSAMDAAQRMIEANPLPAGGGGTVASVTPSASASSGGSTGSAALGSVGASSRYVLPSSSGYSYYSTSDIPAWRRFNNFTGSYWAPLRNRRRSGASVNEFVTGSYFMDP